MERTTYDAFGVPDSDYRPERWPSFREDYRFTAKEDDIEAGLYFGARYYQPWLGRWVSPDPLTIHGVGADPNPYAFVYGSPIRFVDPNGLQESGSTQEGAQGCDRDQSCENRNQVCESDPEGCWGPSGDSKDDSAQASLST